MAIDRQASSEKNTLIHLDDGTYRTETGTVVKHLERIIGLPVRKFVEHQAVFYSMEINREVRRRFFLAQLLISRRTRKSKKFARQILAVLQKLDDQCEFIKGALEAVETDCLQKNLETTNPPVYCRVIDPVSNRLFLDLQKADRLIAHIHRVFDEGTISEKEHRSLLGSIIPTVRNAFNTVFNNPPKQETNADDVSETSRM